MFRRTTTALLATGLIGLGLAGAAAHGGGPEAFRGRGSALSPEDRAAFADARIAALHAGLKLTPDQEKLWPPVEAAMRDMATMRESRRAAMRDRPSFETDAPGALRAMADAASARGDALRKLADAMQPLYASLDADQRRRAMILARPMRGSRHMGGWHRGPDGGPGMGPRPDGERR